MPEETRSKQFIIYADDDLDDLFLVQDAFQKFSSSAEVLTFPDGLAVLNYLLSVPEDRPLPCLILLDINMPRLNGKEVFLELRKSGKFAKTPVVLFTTSSQAQDREFARQHRIGFQTKPVNYKEMQGIAERFLSHCGKTAALEPEKRP